MEDVPGNQPQENSQTPLASWMGAVRKPCVPSDQQDDQQSGASSFVWLQVIAALFLSYPLIYGVLRATGTLRYETNTYAVINTMGYKLICASSEDWIGRTLEHVYWPLIQLELWFR